MQKYDATDRQHGFRKNHSFCREHDIRLIIDAAHPFAQQLHLNIFLAAKELTIKVVRLERIYPELSEEIIWCDDFEDAVARMKQDGIEKLLDSYRHSNYYQATRFLERA